MRVRGQLEGIKNQCQSNLTIEPNKPERLLRELADCCIQLDERLAALENRGLPEGFSVGDPAHRQAVESQATRQERKAKL